MLNVSKEIRKCYAHAEDCACNKLERNWLKLARSYEAVAVSAPATLGISFDSF